MDGDVLVIKRSRTGIDQVKAGFGVVFPEALERPGPVGSKAGPELDFKCVEAARSVGDKVDFPAAGGAVVGEGVLEFVIVIDCAQVA